MIIQFFEEQNLLRDIILLLRFFAIFYIFFIVSQAINKMKRGKSYSLGIGFVIFLISIALYHFLVAFEYFYFKEELKPFFFYLRGLLLFGGIVCFTFFAELEYNYHKKMIKKGKKRVPCPLTIISVIGTIIILYLTIENYINYTAIFIYISIIFGIIGFKFIKKFKNLEIIKRTKQLPWLIVGFIMILSSCFFNSSYMLTIFSIASFHMGTVLIIIGSILTNKGWSRIPLLSELDWMTRMDKILIIELKTSSLIYQYSFLKSDEIDQNNLIKDTVTGSVMGGLNQLLQKILEVEGHIQSLEYGDKRIYFSQGIYSICVLITTGFSNEFTYRLEMFLASFEKAFENYLGNNWRGELTAFERTEKLILDHFTK